MNHPIPALIAGLLLGFGAFAAPAPTDPGNELFAMSFNLRYASENPPNAWPARRPVMRACIESVAPDLIGTQEGVYRQLKDLASDLPGYDWIGLGRDGGSRGEFMAVVYRKDRFEPMAYDHFWLSDTPETMGSSTWGHSNRRMVTWVRFKNRSTGLEFFFWNTHLDHANQTAREKAAALILERSKKLDAALPFLLVGDFNAEAGNNKAYDILVRPDAFADAWKGAPEVRGPKVNTFHNYQGEIANDRRIDWILHRGPVSVRAVQVVTYSRMGQYPSDHFPVAAWVKLGP